MSSHGKDQVKSPSHVLKFEILFLAEVWEQDLAAAVLLVLKVLCGVFSTLRI